MHLDLSPNTRNFFFDCDVQIGWLSYDEWTTLEHE